MQIHGIAFSIGRRWTGVAGECSTVRLPSSRRSTLQCSVAPGPSLVHCNPIKINGVPGRT
jgi:hypothetical protein